MKTLWISILLFLASMAACSNMTGLFLSDWQNQGEGQCVPSYFTITQTSANAYIAAYNYTSDSAAQFCSFVLNFTGNYSAELSQAANGTWIDTTGHQLIYDETHDVFYFFLEDEPNDSPYLYDRNGSYVPIELGLDNIGGTWVNPTPLNTSSYNTCCVPGSLFVTIGSQSPIQGGLNIMPNYSTTTCSSHNDAFPLASILTPSTDKLTWAGYGSIMTVKSNYLLDPYNASQLTVRLDENDSCWYTYDKLPDQNLISGTWYLDWQTTNAIYVPQNYTISIVNGTFMQGTLEFETGTSTSYVVGNGQNQYTDSTLQLTFAYDQPTNTLLAIDNPYSQALYSSNGSILPNYLGNTSWNDAQPEHSDSDSLDTCCVPNLISIVFTNVQNALNVTYTLPNDYESNPACDDIVQFVNSQNELESVLNIQTPNIHLVTWSDPYSTKIPSVNASTTSEILVSDFLGTGCSFKMTSTSKPKPLSGLWMSIEIKAAMILCMVILFGII